MFTTQNMQRRFGAGFLLAIFTAGTSFAASEAEFNSLEDAVGALHKAVDSDDQAAISQLLGPLASSGDIVQDKSDRERFIQKYSEMHRFAKQPDGTTMLYVGAENWPFPVPLVSTNGKWRFDVDAGSREMMFRRIGEDETTAIETCEHIARGAANPPAESFHGYQFRFLGRQKGVFVIAYPAEYGSTGVMTFAVTPDGSVYEKDLGPKTAELAQGMTRYKADRTWHLAR